jgi:hypothetical protein
MADIFENKNSGFNILSGNSTSGHGGYGVGIINLDNITPVIICPEDQTVEVDPGAMHARSKVERRIKFTTNREDSEGGKFYWLVWLNTDRGQEGPYYRAAGASEMVVNREKKRGYKILADHVTKMDKAMKGQVHLEDMDDASKKLLKDFLINHDAGMWERANPELKKQLEV